MGWVKRHLNFLVGAFGVLLLVGLAISLFSNSRSDNYPNANSGISAAEQEKLTKRSRLSSIPPDDAVLATAARKSTDTEVAAIRIKFRAVSLTKATGRPEANKETAYSILKEVRSSPVFEADPQETRVSEDLSVDEEPGTFTVSVVARLKHPIKVY